MVLADLESREVLLSKLAGAMKASMAKAAQVFDALRIKMESGAPASAEAAPAVEAATEAPAEAVAEAPAAEAVAEVPAETPTETPTEAQPE
jgi:large subunit ribosomal protein L10